MCLPLTSGGEEDKMVVAGFDLYALLVEQLFGGVFLAVLGVAAIMLVIAMFGKVSFSTMTAILIYYIIICGINYSVLFLFLMTFFILVYLIYAGVGFWNRSST
jgi:hypothetical protein